MSLLVLRPDRLGDFILSTPALRELENKAGKGSLLTIVAGERNKDIARFFFPKARILVFRKSLLGRLFLFARLWSGRYDVTLDFHSYPFSTTSALMTLLSGSHRRVGFLDSGGYRELSRKVFNLGVPPPGANLPEKDKTFLLVKKLFPRAASPGKSFPVPALPPKVRDRVEAFYQSLNLGKKDRMVGLHPTLQKKDNRWSQERYLELIHQLRQEPNVKIVIVDGKGELAELERFKGALGTLPGVFVLPANDILFILGAAQRFDFFVCGDSGLTHLAALVTRVLAIFGPSDPRRWGPLETAAGKPKIFRKKDWLCDSVTAEEVVKEIRKSL
jgi:ADP-heptose:LPS heptosyltransferase